MMSAARGIGVLHTTGELVDRFELSALSIAQCPDGVRCVDELHSISRRAV